MERYVIRGGREGYARLQVLARARRADTVELLRQAAERARQAADAEPQAGDHPLNELQQRIAAATQELRKRGHPSDTP